MLLLGQVRTLQIGSFHVFKYNILRYDTYRCKLQVVNQYQINQKTYVLVLF